MIDPVTTVVITCAILKVCEGVSLNLLSNTVFESFKDRIFKQKGKSEKELLKDAIQELKKSDIGNDLLKAITEKEDKILSKSLEYYSKISKDTAEIKQLSELLNEKVGRMKEEQIEISEKTAELLDLVKNLIQQTKVKKLVKSYDDVMRIEDAGINNLLDWPILKDLKSGKKSEVYNDEDKLTEIDQILTDRKKRRILLNGAGGRGKTVLSRLLAYKKRQDDWNVYFIDVRELDTTDLETLTGDIHHIIKNSENSTLFIFENAHYSDDNTDELVKSADNFVESNKKQNCHFLFNSRDFARDEDINPFSNWKKRGMSLLIHPNNELIENIVNQYIHANNKKYQLSQEDKEWIKANILPKEDAESTTVGGDLRLLRLYLIAWRNKDNRRLRELEEQDVIISLKKFLLVDELSRDPTLADLLGKVSSVFQFDVPFYSRRTNWSDSKDYIKDLEQLRSKGKIKYTGKDFYTLTHSLDAYYITKCLASHDNQSHHEYTGNKIVEYIGELPDHPANIIIENLVELFRALYNNQQEFEKEVFTYIFSNARKRIITLVLNYYEGLGMPGHKYHEGLGILSRILNLIEIYLGKEEAFAFWEKIHAEIKPDHWKEILLRNKPFYIALLIQVIQRISPDGDIINLKFISDNFDKIYQKSDLHRLEELFRPLPNSIVDQLTDKMDAPSFASKIMESKRIYLEFMIIKLNKDFLKNVFLYIKNNEWNSFLEFFRKENSKKYPKSLLGRIRRIDIDFEKCLQIELKSYFEDLKNQNRKRSPDGRLIIDNKTANNYSNKKFNNDNFRKYLSANFEDDFLITINNVKILKRLLTKIFKSTYNHPEREQGGKIVEQIIYQLPDEVLKDCCLDSDLLDLIEKANKQAYEYACKKCMDLY